MVDFLITNWDIMTFCCVTTGLLWWGDFIPRRNHNFKKNLCVCTMTFIYVLSVLLIFVYLKEHEEDQLAAKLLGYAPSYAWVFERLGHDQLNDKTSADDPLYLSLIEHEKGWLKANPFVSDIYTMKKSDSGGIYLLVDSETDYDRDGAYRENRESRTKIGELYDRNIPELEQAFSGHSSFTYRPYSDRWGNWVSAFVPLRNSQGQVDGVLGLDFPASDYIGEISRLRYFLLSLATLMLLLIFVLLIGRRKQEYYNSLLRSSLREAKEAASIKSEFLARMSHEIRTPLNGILGIISLLSEQNLNREMCRQISIMQNCGRTLMDLINDILDYSKIEAGKLKLEEIPFNLNEAVQEVIELLSFSAEAKGLKITYNHKGSSNTLIKSDLGRFRQVLMNLISNAIKFTSEGNILVQTQADHIANDQTQIYVSVTDSGMGISPEGMKLLFQSFTQVDVSTTRKFGGTGLGLAICKGIMDALGGTIEVQSEVGKGSTFSISFKALTGPQFQVVNSQPTDICSKQLPKTLRILVADDNGTNRMLAVRFLEKLGYVADSVANGFEVLNLLDQRSFDVIFMDCQMPEMDGFTTTRKILSRYSPKYRPWIIAMTASAFQEDRDKCLAAGMNDFIPKPFDVRSISESLQRIVPKPKSFLDVALVEKHFAGDLEILSQMIDKYLSSFDAVMEDLNEAIRSGSASQVQFLCHKLRGSVSNFHVPEIQQDILDLELKGRQGDLQNAESRYLWLVQKLERLNEEIRQFASVRKAG